jgi:hypothetical protein
MIVSLDFRLQLLKRKIHLVGDFWLLLSAVLTFGGVFLQVEDLFPIISDIERERVS